MKRFCIPVLAVALAIMHSCADYQEEPAPASFSVGSTELSFSSTASSQSMSVSSGKRWDISSMPDWVSVQSITTNGLYQWAVSFSVSENNNYNRAGTILFQSSAGSAEVAVKQDGKKGDNVAVAAVDLGLSVKWATCNVGASSPEENGNCYAWGETSTKNGYSWGSYKWCNGSSSSMTKYNTETSYGTVDNKTHLELSDDVSRANWGGKWRIPTDAEWTELLDNCTWTWTNQSGVSGYRITSKKNSNSIFLPAAGYRYDTTLSSAGSGGFYWSSTVSTDNPYSAYYVYFDSDYVYENIYSRYYGLSVRPVKE